MNGKLLGVDYGDVRTGLAVSDPSGLIATGIGTIRPGGMRHTAVAVAEAARERACAGIVIGLPKNMDGMEGPRAERRGSSRHCWRRPPACRSYSGTSGAAPLRRTPSSTPPGKKKKSTAPTWTR